MFVSDILEPLLGASDVRGIVRSACLTALEHLPPQIAARMEPLTGFIGGKCMAYPAVWIVGELTTAPLGDLRLALTRAPMSTALALSTSITDDLVDGDQKTSHEHVVLLYMLILQALDAGGWQSGQHRQATLRWFAEIVADFLGEGDAMRAGPWAYDRDKHRRRGRRIGHFHRMIAAELLSQLGADPALVEAGTEIAGDFGAWCADLDDVLDAEVDLLQGAFGNVMVSMLLDLWPDMAGAVESASPLAVARLCSPAVTERTVVHMIAEAAAIARRCRNIGSARLADRLDRLCTVLPDRIRELRSAANAEFVARR